MAKKVTASKTELKKNKKAKKSARHSSRRSGNPGVAATLKILLIFFVAVSLIFIAARTIGGVTLTSVAGEIKVFFQSLGWGDGYPYKTTGESAQQIYSDGNRLFAFSKDKTVLLSSTAKEISELPVEYGNPALKFKNNRALIYDRDSSKMRIQSTSEIICEKDEESNILAAAIGKKGNYAVAVQKSGVISVLRVYNKNEEKIFSKEFNTEKITDIDLSDDGKYAVVSTIVSVDAQVDSKVYVFKFDSKDYTSCFDFKKSAVVGVNYDSSHNIIVLSNTGRSYIKDNTTLGKTQEFASDILFKTSFTQGKYSAVALKRYGGDNYGTVKIFNGNNQVASVNIDEEIKDVYCSGRYTAVLTNNSVMIYKNSNGKLKSEVSADLSVSEIVLKNRKIYMMTPTEIIRQKF